MRKISLKSVICVFFSAITAMGLSACMVEPVSYTEFVEEIIEGGESPFKITFSLIDVGGGNLALSAGSFSENINFGNLFNGSSITLTVNQAGLISPTYQWLYNGADVSPANTTSTFVFAYNSSNTFTENYLRGGGHTITLILESNSKTYSSNFKIVVEY